MRKLTFCLRRKPGLSWEEFDAYWRDVHAPLVRERAALLGIRRYVQVRTVQDPGLHARFQARNDGSPMPFDGIAELWYDDDLPPSVKTDEGRRAARELLADERNFIDLPRSPMWFGREWQVIPGDAELAPPAPLPLTREQLLGVWTLDEWAITFADQRPPRHPFGADATGMLLYTREGRMSVTVTANGRQRLASDSIRQASVEERAAAFATLFHYSGRFAVDAHGVTHLIEQAANPNLVGTSQQRAASLSGDRLTLSTEDSLAGVVRRHALVWRRLRPDETR
jgi:uncharacterized protein (TIGR02118 family)